MSQMEKWHGDLNAQEKETNQPDWGAMIRHSYGQLRTMARAGVPVVVGTDVGFVGIYPGFSVHDEMERLAEATGMSPREVLLMGTLNAARLAGLEKETGGVEAGKRADLVLLDANPFEDIRNTKRIHAVVLGGRYLGPAELERLRSEAARTKDTPDEDFERDYQVEPAALSDPARLTRLGTYWFAEGSYAKAAAYFARAQELGPSRTSALGLFLASFNDLTEKSPATTVRQLVERAGPIAAADAEHRVDLVGRVVQLAAQRKEIAAVEPLMGSFAAIRPETLTPRTRVAWHGAMATYLPSSDPAAAYRHKVETMPAGWQQSADQLNSIAWWSFENGVELEAARRHAEEGMRLATSPEQKAAIVDTLAEIRNAQGFPAEALALAKQAAALSPTDFFKKQVTRFQELADKAGRP